MMIKIFILAVFFLADYFIFDIVYYKLKQVVSDKVQNVGFLFGFLDFITFMLVRLGTLCILAFLIQALRLGGVLLD